MRRLLCASLLLSFFSCDLLTGGGGGGGGGTINFQRGFVFLRPEDRNLYVADEKSYVDVQQLTTAGGARHPSLSKNGRVVVFVASTGSDTSLATVPVAGGAVSTVFQSTTTVKNLRTPVFSPDGQKVVFAYDDGAGSSVGVVNLDGSGFEKLGGGALSYTSPSFLPDGLSVLVAAGAPGSGYNQVERITLSTKSAVNVASTLGNEAQQVVDRLVVSPDGSKAAFDGRISSTGTRIFVMDLTSKAVTQLTDYPGEPGARDAFPTWVGNDKVGFSSDTGGAEQVYVLPASSTKTSGGLTLPKALQPSYGPN